MAVKFHHFPLGQFQKFINTFLLIRESISMAIELSLNARSCLNGSKIAFGTTNLIMHR